MSEIFDVEPKSQSVTTVTPTPVANVVPTDNTNLDKDLDNDYEESRRTLKDLVKKGNDAIDHLLAIASESEHPRAFEVVGNLMKQLADVNQQLMDLHQQKAKLDAPKKGADKVTNNAIFVGSTAELSKMLGKMNKGE
mgnify:CR=1 FL=1